MSAESVEALEVLREVWRSQGQTAADLDESCEKSCRRMTDAGLAFQQDRLAHPDREKQRRRELVPGQIAGLVERGAKRRHVREPLAEFYRNYAAHKVRVYRPGSAANASRQLGNRSRRVFLCLPPNRGPVSATRNTSRGLRDRLIQARSHPHRRVTVGARVPAGGMLEGCPI